MSARMARARRKPGVAVGFPSIRRSGQALASFVLALPILLICDAPRAAVVVDWSDVDWFAWTAPASIAIGGIGSEEVTITATGSAASVGSPGVTNFDTDGNELGDLPVPSIAVGAPSDSGGSVVYTIDVSQVNAQTSTLLVGFHNLDAINLRGSITMSATDRQGSTIDVGVWDVEAQFKLDGPPYGGQSLVTVDTSPVNQVFMQTVQAGDNTSWGDSRGIFFSGLPNNLGEIVLVHSYANPNPPTVDNVVLYVGLVGFDADDDGVGEDGDGSGTPGDSPCTGGNTVACDDNCPDDANADQTDADSDGIGDVCDALTVVPGPGAFLALPLALCGLAGIRGRLRESHRFDVGYRRPRRISHLSSRG